MKHLLILIFITISLCSYSQNVWTIDDCMEYAVKMSYNSQRAERNMQTAQQEYIAAVGRHLPSFSGSVNAGSNFGRGIDPATNTYVNTTTFSNNYGVGVALPIFNAFELLNNTLASKLAVARSESEMQKAKDDIALSVMSCYIDVLYNSGLVELTTKRVETFRNDLIRTQRMSELGTRSEVDVAQFDAALATEELLLITHKNNLNTSILTLKKIMNYPIEDTLVVEINIAIRKRDFENAATIFNNADKYLPQIDILKKNMKHERYQLSIIKSSYYPSISASGGVATNYFKMLSGNDSSAPPFSSQFNNNVGEYFSVALSIPIFKGLTARTSVKRAKIAYKQALSDFDENLRELRIEIEQAVMDLNAARISVDAAVKAATASLLANNAAKRKYEEGMISVIELQTSSNQLLMSQVEYLSAQLRYEIKSRQVAYFSGEALVK